VPRKRLSLTLKSSVHGLYETAFFVERKVAAAGTRVFHRICQFTIRGYTGIFRGGQQLNFAVICVVHKL